MRLVKHVAYMKDKKRNAHSGFDPKFKEQVT